MKNKKFDYLIIGAGIAGLGAAYELQKQGKQVLVLEKEPFVGGRMSTMTINGIPIDLGAKFLLPSAYKNISRLASEVDLSFSPIPASKFAVIKNGTPLFCDAKNIVSILHFKGLSTMAKLQLGVLLTFLLIRYPNLDMYHLNKALPLDNESVYDFFKKYIPQECFDYLLDPLCNSLFAYDSKEFSKAFFLSVLPKMMKSKFYSFEGGINKLCLKLAQKVPTQCNISVQSINREDNTVVVLADDINKKEKIRYHAKRVIVAIPGNKVLEILNKPTNIEKAFFSNVKYSKSTIIHFKGKSNAFKNFSTIWFPEKENRHITSIVKNFYNSKNRTSDVFELGLRQSFVQELKKRNQFTKENISKILEKELDIQDIQIFHITQWEGMCPKVEPGYLKRRYDFLEKSESEKQIFYCGDYLENPSTEGALTSGLAVARRVIEATQI